MTHGISARRRASVLVFLTAASWAFVAVTTQAVMHITG